LMAAGVSKADVLKLKQGGGVQGVLVSADSKEVVFMGLDGTEKTYPVSAVAGITFAPLPPPPKPAPPAVLTIPAGTHISVRTIDSIDGKTAQVGARYRASIDDPVGVGSQVVIAHGANCTLEVVSLQSGEGMALPGVLILDTIGELRALYRRAAVAFVGGSLAPGRGGQNLAEPAAASVPVLFGPFHQTQEQMASALVAARGARVVNDSDQLADACAEWLANESLRVATGKNARAALDRLAGSVGPTLMRLKALASLS